MQILNTINMRCTLLIAGFLFAFGVGLNCQNLHVTHYSTANGLPSNKVQHVVQDTFGFLWIATDNGLVRFDGNQFTTFEQEVPSQYGRYLWPTAEGILFSHDAGLSRIQPALDSSKIVLSQPASIDPSSELLYYPDRLFQRGNGTTWVSQPNGEVVLFVKNQKKTFVVGQSKEKNSSFFAETTSGAFWVATQAGDLFLYDEAQDSLLQIKTFKKINDFKAINEELWGAGSAAVVPLAVPEPADGAMVRVASDGLPRPVELDRDV